MIGRIWKIEYRLKFVRNKARLKVVFKWRIKKWTYKIYFPDFKSKNFSEYHDVIRLGILRGWKSRER